MFLWLFFVSFTFMQSYDIDHEEHLLLNILV